MKSVIFILLAALPFIAQAQQWDSENKWFINDTRRGWVFNTDITRGNVNQYIYIKESKSDTVFLQSRLMLCPYCHRMMPEEHIEEVKKIEKRFWRGFEGKKVLENSGWMY